MQGKDNKTTFDALLGHFQWYRKFSQKKWYHTKSKKDGRIYGWTTEIIPNIEEVFEEEDWRKEE